MANFSKENIRNIALIGHSGEGKTSLLEAILFKTKVTTRLGKVDDGTSISDYDPEEIARKMSIGLSLAFTEYKGCKINILDVPGFFDFEGEMVSALAVADAAILVTGAAGNVPVGAEMALEKCAEKNIPVLIWVNGINKENANYDLSVKAYKEKYGNKIAVIELPLMEGNTMKGYLDVLSGKAFDSSDNEITIPEEMKDRLQQEDSAIIEVAAESSEELLEKFFGGEELTGEEKKSGLRTRFVSGELMPIMGGVAIGSDYCISSLLDRIVELCPNAGESKPFKYTASDGTASEIKVSENGSFAGLIFKTTVDPFVGKLLMVKIVRGKVAMGDLVFNSNTEENEKISAIYNLRGKKQENTDSLSAGDIGAFAKLNYTSTGNTLCASVEKIKFDPIDFPSPVISFAVSAAEKGAEDKVIAGFNKLMDEDSTFKIEKNIETNEMVISGIGEMQLDILSKKVKNKYNVSAILKEPRIAYRETIKKTVEAEGKHKKQSGGAGQFGQCSVRFEPGAADGLFEFVDAVVGGAIPRQFIPAVEKGLREAIKQGILADYPMYNLKATVFDGKSHPVDSKEVAYIMAAKYAYQEGCAKANPVFLEPIYNIKVIVPDSFMGDIMGDMNKRRGRILGTDVLEGKAVVEAEVPQSEIGRYATDLRSMTQGRGRFQMTLARYEEVPALQTQKIIEDYKKRIAENA